MLGDMIYMAIMDDVLWTVSIGQSSSQVNNQADIVSLQRIDLKDELATAFVEDKYIPSTVVGDTDVREENDKPYQREFCFLHGGGHIPKDLQGTISSKTQCASMGEDKVKKGEDRTTSYYIWLPFILATIAIITTTLPVVLLESIDERLNTNPPTVNVLIIFSAL